MNDMKRIEILIHYWNWKDYFRYSIFYWIMFHFTWLL